MPGTSSPSWQRPGRSTRPPNRRVLTQQGQIDSAIDRVLPSPTLPAEMKGSIIAAQGRASAGLACASHLREQLHHGNVLLL
jgi:hypothetical protein